MGDILATVERPVAVRQAIQAGSNFDGGAPEDGGGLLTPAFTIDLFKFAAGTKGGLFDLTSNLYSFEKRITWALVGVELILGGQSAWILQLLDVDNNAITLFNGTTETSYLKKKEECLTVLPWGSKLKLATTGASGALMATLKFAPANQVA